jgi:uncharacterized phage protein (TIGR01671 family)
MRDIKFRAWDKVHSMMVEVAAIFTETGSVKGIYGKGSEIFMAHSNVVLMQFTGLRDRDRKEIYEGDILEGAENAVHWDEQAAHHDFGLLVGQLSTMKVIGNIYENPELLS